MGCIQSNPMVTNGNHFKWSRGESITQTLTTANYNDTEIDISHFHVTEEILGLGGFGMVRLVSKLTGKDKGKEFALKSMSKDAVLKRSSGPSSIITELRALIMLSDCYFICRLHYAFQSSSHLYMVLELGIGGDMRYYLRSTPQYRFSETASKYLICQVLISLDYCHKSSILHRGK